MPCLPLLLSGACLALALSNRLPASSPLMRMAYAPAPLVVPSSDFASELAYRTVTASTFAGAPLASYDPVTRAKVLTRWARLCDAEAHPEELIQDAVVGEDVNGNRRGPNMADYDWLRGKRRIACKSAQLTWEESNECWYLRFSAVKLQACACLLDAQVRTRPQRISLSYTPLTGVRRAAADGDHPRGRAPLPERPPLAARAELRRRERPPPPSSPDLA